MKIKLLIPARLNSTRLPKKPLAEIAGKPMIAHVLERAKSADIGEVAVATDSKKIAEIVEKYGGKAVLTDENHQSGSDRIWQAAQILGVAENDIIINLQGDLPTIEPEMLRTALVPMENQSVDFATLAAPISNPTEHKNPNVVKLVGTSVGKNIMRAIYFSRANVPYGEAVRYHHIGIYVWRAKALEKFINLPPSPLEQCEKLEQLRALENGMLCHACIIDKIPLSIDTPEDLALARKLLNE